jgi:hypothetical protein
VRTEARRDIADEAEDEMDDGIDPLVMGVRDRWEGQGLRGGPWPFMSICAVGRLNQLLTKALEVELKRLGLTESMADVPEGAPEGATDLVREFY